MQQRGDRRKALILRAGRTNAWPTARSGQGRPGYPKDTPVGVPRAECVALRLSEQ